MNTNLIVGLVAGAIVIGGGAYYVMSGTGDSAQANDAQGSAAQEDGAFSGSIADLSKRGGEWKCTVDTSADTGAGQAIASGVVYVSGNKVRADYSVDVQGVGSMNAYMISDGEYVYSWSSMMPQGIKTKVTAASSNTGPTSGQMVDANYSYSYDCDPANPDASLFTVPANVTFMTM